MLERDLKRGKHAKIYGLSVGLVAGIKLTEISKKAGRLYLDLHAAIEKYRVAVQSDE
jgi:hypothetical protein